MELKSTFFDIFCHEAQHRREDALGAEPEPAAAGHAAQRPRNDGVRCRRERLTVRATGGALPQSPNPERCGPQVPHPRHGTGRRGRSAAPGVERQ